MSETNGSNKGTHQHHSCPGTLTILASLAGGGGKVPLSVPQNAYNSYGVTDHPCMSYVLPFFYESYACVLDGINVCCNFSKVMTTSKSTWFCVLTKNWFFLSFETYTSMHWPCVHD